MICEIICVAGFLCMSHLDIVHISSVCVHIICILSEHMRIMHILSALVPSYVSFLTDNANVIYMSSLLLFIDPYMLYTHIHIILLCIFHIPHISYYLQLSFRILSPYTHVIRTSSIHHLYCYSWSAWA